MRHLIKIILKQKQKTAQLIKENRRLKSIYLEDIGARDSKISQLNKELKALKKQPQSYFKSYKLT